MISYIPYKAEHIKKLKIQVAQAWMEKHLTMEGLRSLEGEWSSTVLRDGVPIVCGGAIPIWEGRAMLWSFVNGDLTPKDFRALHYLVKGFVNDLPFNRIEMYVDCGFDAGHRWARALGFELEADRMRSFQIEGADSALYARVR